MTAPLTFDHARSCAGSIAYRLQHMGLEVDGQPFDLSKYPYIPEIINCRARRTTIVKGAQMGFTVAIILQSIEEMLTENLRGLLYLLPTDDEVQALAKSRVDPLLAQPAYAHLRSSVDTSSLKQIGKGFMFFRGAGQRGGAKVKSMSKLKSFPADRIKLDEYDEMDQARVDAARHRLGGSTCPREVGLSTPTLPGYGVDLDYQASDQRAWFWDCIRCNERVWLEKSWPECLAEPTQGEPFYLCPKCREPLERRTGTWVAAKPDVKDHAGFRISQLGSLVKSPARILDDWQRSEASGRSREFQNQVLACSYADIEEQLTDAMLNACLDRDRPRARSSAGPCAMGVDPGAKVMHYWIGERITDKDTRTLSYGKVAGFDDIGQLAKKFHVKSGVMDIGAETRKVREFLDAHPGWWGCQYVEKRTAGYDWNPREHIVKVGRTEALDASHDAILCKRTSLPAPDETYHDLVLPQMKNLARTKIEDEQTGNVTMKWVVTGGQKDDHLKHAHAYFEIAAERVGLAESVQRAMNARRVPARRRSAMLI